MMKKTISILTFLTAFSFGSIAQADIAAARTFAQGASVTVKGLVTNGSTLGPIRYIQDNTAGIPIYDPNNTNPLNIGDSISVTGVMSEFNGLIQIGAPTTINVISTGNSTPDPKVVLTSAIGLSNESELIRVNGVTFNNGGTPWSVGTHNFTDGSSNSGVIYLRSGHPLVGTNIPLSSVDLVGISSQFSGTPQVLPRDANDMILTSSFFVTETVSVANITQTTLDISFKTNIAGSTNVRYGTTPAMTNDVQLGGSTTSHTASITGLSPAEFYYVQGYSDDGSGTTAESSVKIFSTASNSTGAIRAIFNQTVDHSVSTGTFAEYLQGWEIENLVIQMIDDARQTIDFTAYNFNRTTIVTALNNAHNRGVQVRMIANNGSANIALQNGAAQFPVIYGNSVALHHNKFVTFDAGMQDDSWVWTGALNWTAGQISTDIQNTILIQDQALAKAYTWEFDEMWGSTGPNPGILTSKFGADKTDNTPHEFILKDGTELQCYFSPSDGTTAKIEEALRSTDNDLSVATLSFTRNELGTAVFDAHQAGHAVRVIIENTGDQGTEYTFFNDNGVPVQSHPPSPIFHHKYAVVDARDASSDPIVVTGSHNWSTAAETRNDENTLIIHNAVLANEYDQEFTQRWWEVAVGTKSINGQAQWNLSVYPNPTTDFVNVSVRKNFDKNLWLTLYTQDGKLLTRQKMSDASEQLDMAALPKGQYYLGVGNDSTGWGVEKLIRK